MTQSSHRSKPPLGTGHLPVFRVLARLLSRAGTAYVWLMYRKDLTRPMAAYHAKVPVDIGLADDAEMDALAALYHHQQPAKAAGRARIYRDRLRGGSLCFVARVDGAIVASNWIRVKTAIGADQLRMYFGDDEIYTTDAYTADEWRGQGIHPALNQTMLEHARQQGYRIAYTMVRADNERSWVTMGRVGWEHAGTMLFFRPSWMEGRALWQVWGDPYPMPVGRGAPAMANRATDGPARTALAPTPAPADSAAFDLTQFEQRELVADKPWAKTYRMRKGDQLAWLKIVPSEQAGVLQAAVLLARDHPAHLPEVIACDHRQHGWLLTRDQGGTPLDAQSPADLLAMVETYARLQAASTSRTDLMACLPAAELEHVLPSLLDFLDPDRLQPDDEDRVGAAFFVRAADAAAYRDVLQQAAPVLTQHLALASTLLPDTVNHGDLQTAHAVKSGNGDIVLLNWSHATRGPAGLSLHRLFGGAVAALTALEAQADEGSEPALNKELMARYINTLASAGYASEPDLRSGLRVSIIAGAMLDLLRFADFPTEDADPRQLIRQRLMAGLQDLQMVCVRGLRDQTSS